MSSSNYEITDRGLLSNTTCYQTVQRKALFPEPLKYITMNLSVDIIAEGNYGGLFTVILMN